MTPKKKKEIISLLYDKVYIRLYQFALRFVHSEDEVKDIIQESFIVVWKNLDSIQIGENYLESYLHKVFKNKLIDAHRKLQSKEKHLTIYNQNRSIVDEMDSIWEIQKTIAEVYLELPDRTADFFRLSRNEGLSYAEIAELRMVSVKTVETHISKALRVFRKRLKDFL